MTCNLCSCVCMLQQRTHLHLYLTSSRGSPLRLHWCTRPATLVDRARWAQRPVQLDSSTTADIRGRLISIRCTPTYIVDGVCCPDHIHVACVIPDCRVRYLCTSVYIRATDLGLAREHWRSRRLLLVLRTRQPMRGAPPCISVRMSVIVVDI